MDEVFPPFVFIKPFVHGSPRTSTPTVYGGNRLFHRNGGITKFMVGEVFPLPPFVLVKPFVHGQPRTSVPTVYGGNRLFHRSREVTQNRR